MSTAEDEMRTIIGEGAATVRHLLGLWRDGEPFALIDAIEALTADDRGVALLSAIVLLAEGLPPGGDS